MRHEFWDYLGELVDTSQIIIDRPKRSTHHCYRGSLYPVDYGYLQGIAAMDAAKVDIWVGSLGGRKVVGALCTVDLLKRDIELKILFDCTNQEISSIFDFVNTDKMHAIFIDSSQGKENSDGLDT